MFQIQQKKSRVGLPAPLEKTDVAVFIKKLEGEGRGNLQVIGMLAGGYAVVW